MNTLRRSGGPRRGGAPEPEEGRPRLDGGPRLPFYDLVPTAYHEAFHQYLQSYIGKGVDVPTWFNEGMASYFEKMQETRGTKKLDHKSIDNRKLRMIQEKIATRSAIPLEKLIDAPYSQFHDKESSQLEGLYYTQSFAVIYYFMQAMGGKPVFQFADELRKSKDPAKAYEKMFGKERKNLKSVEAKWKQYTADVKVQEPPKRS